MSQLSSIGRISTTVKTGSDGVTRVTYHTTDVVSFTSTLITLDTGGWFTSSTQNRMNQTSNQFDLGYKVFHRDGCWYVEYEGVTQRFKGNSITITRLV